MSGTCRKLDIALREKFNADCDDLKQHHKKHGFPPSEDLWFFLDDGSVNAEAYFRRKISIVVQFESALTRLGTYANHEGGMYDTKTGADTECRIGVDFAPLSFCFIMYCRKSETSPWEYWFNGGLIYQGPEAPADGSAPSLTVSMDSTRVGWFIHT